MIGDDAKGHRDIERIFNTGHGDLNGGVTVRQ
jgi:hypothetical protein